ncbi:hypothetical protein [Thalassotalea sp. SU-HH00458]|uniref:hypothetical protein n=1 Tax=Thalassotalea sp. SU-HH00458 TaxID=3127657 RepID=UPI003103798E
MDEYHYNEKQAKREKMAEIRKYKKPTESLVNKKKRCSENTALVEETEREISNINEAVDTILHSIGKLNKEEAWSIGCDNTKQLFTERLHLLPSIANKLKELSKLKTTFEPQGVINDLVVLDFFKQLNCEDLAKTTLKIIKQKNRSIDLDTVIKTIKRIHVEHLKNFYIPEDVLVRFCNNRYVMPTRPEADSSDQTSNIHFEFEVKVNPTFSSINKSKSRRSIKQKMGVNLKL